MKKLSLGKLKLLADEVLQRSQMANIYGGSGTNPYCDAPGTCGYRDPSGFESCYCSKSTVMGWWVAQYGGNYCCDSCHSNGGPAGYC